MSTTTLIIGPEHDGQRMSLAEFENAEACDDASYELGRGIVYRIEVPGVSHFLQLNHLSHLFYRYDANHPSVIDSIVAGAHCAVVCEPLNSVRRPDIALYLTEVPSVDDADLWSVWVPEIVVEVVSPDSICRDYEDQPDEYFQAGVKEYWIVDTARQQLTILQRYGGRWKEHRIDPPAQYTTHLLPGFELDVAAVFEAAKGT